MSSLDSSRESADQQNRNGSQVSKRPAATGYANALTVDLLDSIEEADELDDALKRGDDAAAKPLIQAQRERAYTGWVVSEMLGQDPEKSTPPFARGVHPEIQLERLLVQRSRKEAAKQQILSEVGFDNAKAVHREMVQQLKDRKEESVLYERPDMTEQELVELRAQYQPAVFDPDRLAEARRVVAQAQERIRREVDPEFNIWKDPTLGVVARSVSEEGRLAVSGEHTLAREMSGVERALMPVRGAITGAVGEVTSLVQGATDLGQRAIHNLSGGRLFEHYVPPTEFVEDVDGRSYANDGKVSGGQVLAALWSTLWGHEVGESISDLKHVEERFYEEMAPGTFERIAGEIGMSVGALAPMVAIGGPGTKLAMTPWVKGLTWLGSKGLGQAAHAERASKIMGFVTGAAGAATFNAAYEAVRSGAIEGYGKMAAHGAMWGPVFTAIGLIGRRTEAALQSRNVPSWFARPLAGAVEGLGMTVALDPKPLWDFVRNPNKETWTRAMEPLAVNIGTMAILKGAWRTPPETLAMGIPQARQRGLRPSAEETVEFAQRQQVAEVAAKEAAREQRPTALEQRPREGPPSDRLVTEEELAVLRGRSERWTEERRRTAEKIKELREERRVLQTDPETGVSTPETFRRAKERVDAAEGQEWVQVDVRGLKELNDLVSQEAGDAQIRKVANAIRMAAAERGIDPRNLFRAGGDEFAIAVPRGTGEQLGQAIVKAVGLEKIGDTPFVTGARHGVGATWEASGAAVQSAKAMEKEPTLRGQKRAAEQAARGEKILRAEERVGMAPEQVRPAVEEATRARQELASEAAKVHQPRDLAEAREEGLQRIREGGELVEAPMPRRVPGMLKQEAVPGTEPTRASDVLLSLQGFEGDPVRVAARRGKLGMGKRTLGWFKQQEGLMRSRGARDLDVWAHEWSHAMESATVGLRWMPTDPAAKAQLRQLGGELYGPDIAKLPIHRQVAEGWAEFWARDLWGDTTLQAHVPAAYRLLKAWMAAQPRALQQQYLRNQDLIRRWRDQGAVERVRQAIVMADDPVSKEMKRAMGPAWKRVKEALDLFTDDLAKMKRAQKRWFDVAGIKEDDVSIQQNAYRMATVLRGSARDVTDTFLWKATLGVDRLRTGEGLAQALKEVRREELREFVTYAYARRSLEVQDKGMVTQLSRDDLLATVAALGSPRFERAVKRMKEWSDRLIDYGVQSGSISEESGQLIKDAWGVYVPFFRAMVRPLGETARMAGKPPRGEAERGAGVHRLEGSDIEVRDPLQAMMEVTHSIIQKAHQHAVVKALYTLHLARPKLGGLVNEVPRDPTPIQATAKQLATALKKVGVDVDTSKLTEAQLQGLVTFFQLATRPTGAEPVIAHTVRYTAEEIAAERARGNDRLADRMDAHNGKLKWLELDPDMFESIMGLDAGMGRDVPRAITFATELAKLGYTGVNASFALVTNLGRDVIMQPLFTESPNRFIPVVGGIVDFVIGGWRQVKGRGVLKGITERDPVAQMLMDAGGKGATFFREASAAGPPQYRKLFPTTPTREVVEAMQHPLRTISDLTSGLSNLLSGPEMALRTREMTLRYKNALREGKSHQEAVFEGLEAAREVTQNFVKSGAMIRTGSRLLPYLSARVGGMRKFTRAVFGYDGPKVRNKAIVGGLMGISVPAIINWFLHSDEDWYEDDPDWQKQNYLRFRTPDGTRVNWPLPHEYGKLFGSVPMRVLSQVFGKDKDSAFDSIGDIFMQEIRGYLQLPMIIGPSFETWANKSLFTGRPIVPEWMEEALPPEKRAHPWTTWLARQVGEVIGVSPIKVEYWLAAHTGGMGLSIMRAADDVFGLQDEAKERAPTTSQEELAEMPLVGVMFRQWPHRSGQAVERLYEIDKELRHREEELTPRQRSMRSDVRAAREQLSELFKRAREGRLSREEADKRAFQIASRIVARYERVTAPR